MKGLSFDSDSFWTRIAGSPVINGFVVAAALAAGFFDAKGLDSDLVTPLLKYGPTVASTGYFPFLKLAVDGTASHYDKKTSNDPDYYHQHREDIDKVWSFREKYSLGYTSRETLELVVLTGAKSAIGYGLGYLAGHLTS